MNVPQGLGSEHHELLCGLYLLLDAALADQAVLEEALHEAVEAGVRIVQYRDKTNSMKDAYRKAKRLRELVPYGKMLFIVNDRCDLALAVEADGVHLGQEDLPVALARTILGKNRVIGLSTHHAEQVRAASQEKPDYLGFGPIFPTKSKTQHEPVVGVEGLANIRHLTTLPVFAIGGISASAIPRLREAGADGVAVASGILGAPDRRIAFRQFMDPYRQGT
ncbi:MAG: thiamine phosphate synthase [Nitrospirales bacterium]